MNNNNQNNSNAINCAGARAPARSEYYYYRRWSCHVQYGARVHVNIALALGW